MKKRLLSFVLSFAVVLSFMAAAPVTSVSAAGFTPRFDKPNSGDSCFYSDNIFYKSGYGMPNCTCYAYGRAYELLGKKPSLSTGNAGFWWWYNKNNGIYSYGSTPKLGAIACWDKYDQNSGHVAVVEAVNGNTVTISESHYNSTFFDTRTINSDSSNYLTSMRFLGYIYIGDFNENPNPPSIDLGSCFDAYIINSAAWKMLTAKGSNVELQSETGYRNQLWYFERQSDGSYRIENVANRGCCLDVYNFGGSGTNVGSGASNDSSAQRWKVVEDSGDYNLIPLCSKDCALDVSNGATHDGANVQIYSINHSDAQKFKIWKFNNLPSKPVVVSDKKVYTQNSDVNINWGENAFATVYDVDIWRNGKQFKNLTTSDIGFKYKNITNGLYSVFVYSRNCNGSSKSDCYNFYVTDKDLGGDFYAGIINTETYAGLTVSDENAYFSKNDDVTVKWHFMRNQNGSYTIYSCLNGKVLEVENSSEIQGANVRVADYTGENNQQWYIFGSESAYYLRTPCSRHVLDLTSGKFFEGVNAQMSDFVYDIPAQKYHIHKYNELIGNVIDGSITLSNDNFIYNGKEKQPEVIVKINNTILTENIDYIVSYSDNISIGTAFVTVTGINKYTGVVTETFEIVESNLKADVNGDGKITIVDATMIQKYLAGLETFDDRQLSAADVNDDGRITIPDATYIQKSLAGLI